MKRQIVEDTALQVKQDQLRLILINFGFLRKFKINLTFLKHFKRVRIMILTSVQSVQHPNAGLNIQLLGTWGHHFQLFLCLTHLVPGTRLCINYKFINFYLIVTDSISGTIGLEVIFITLDCLGHRRLLLCLLFCFFNDFFA